MNFDEAKIRAAALGIQMGDPGSAIKHKKFVSLETGESIQLVRQYPASGNLLVRDGNGMTNVFLYYQVGIPADSARA